MPLDRAPHPALLSHAGEELERWHSMWSTIATHLLGQLETGSTAKFDAAFNIVRDAFKICEPFGREVAASALFGDFTRRAIGCGLDRTRFAEWFEPTEVFKAAVGRVRGRVLYFSDAKGVGKVLGADRIIYFVHFMMIRGSGFRSLTGGQLVEFTPQLGVINGRTGPAACDVARLSALGEELVPGAG